MSIAFAIPACGALSMCAPLCVFIIPQRGARVYGGLWKSVWRIVENGHDIDGCNAEAAKQG